MFEELDQSIRRFSESSERSLPVSTTTFLSNETLWLELAARIKAARHVDAAVAYFGQGGAKLLPLRKGDRLVVDMSPATVRAGGTDPRELEKLINKGVQAFTRRNLHAKTVVAGNAVISGSANVSRRSKEVLDEAAILTSDPTAVRRAREFIDRLCTEPVRPEYLEECKRIYKPPRIAGRRSDEQPRQKRAAHAKLWLVNLSEASIPEAEVVRYEQGEEQAKNRLKDDRRSTTESFHWPSKPRMADELELGDWIIQMTTYDDRSVLVSPPGQLLYVDHYARGRSSSRTRWVFHLEMPRRGECMSWPQFRRLARGLLGIRGSASPRTRAVRDIQAADSLLSLWTPGGRIPRR